MATSINFHTNAVKINFTRKVTMKKSSFNLSKLAFAVSSTLILAGCFSDNDNNETIPEPPTPTQNVAVPPVAAAVQAGALTINIADLTGQPLPDSVTAMISFTSSEDGLLSGGGEELTDSDKSTTGSAFAFTVESIPAEGSTYEFIITAEGYLNNNASITLSSTDNIGAKEVRLTPRELSDSDVAVAAATEAVSSLKGESGEDVTVTYDPSTGLSLDGADKIVLKQEIDSSKANIAVGSATVKLKNGTKFLDKDGTALTSAPQMTLAYFANEATRNNTETEDNALESSSLDAFPGGLSLSVTAPNSDTEQVEGSFTSGGFVAIELVDDEGNKVSTFGEDDGGEPISIEVAMQVDKNTLNPCPVTYDEASTDSLSAQAEANGYANGVCTLESPTSRDLAVNDIFPVWSYDEDTGKWSFENYGLVKDSGSANTFDVEVSVNHLSYWNLDYFTYQIGASKCPGNTLSFNVVDVNNDPNTLRADLLIEAKGYRQRIYNYGGNYSEGTFRNPPSFPASIKFIRGSKNVLDGIVGEASADGVVSKLSFDNLCDLNGKTIKLNVTPPSMVSQQFKSQLVCSNTEDFDVDASPVATPAIVYIYDTSWMWQGRVYTGANGLGNFNLEEGSNYYVGYFNYTNYSWNVKEITASNTVENLDIPTICEVEEQPITGGTGSTGSTGGNG